MQEADHNVSPSPHAPVLFWALRPHPAAPPRCKRQAESSPRLLTVTMCCQLGPQAVGAQWRSTFRSPSHLLHLLGPRRFSRIEDRGFKRLSPVLGGYLASGCSPASDKTADWGRGPQAGTSTTNVCSPPGPTWAGPPWAGTSTTNVCSLSPAPPSALRPVPRETSESPKTDGPRAHQVRQRLPQDGPRAPRDGPRRRQEAPRWPHEGP